MPRTVQVWQDPASGRICVRSAYDPDLVAAYKQLPPSMRKWHHKLLIWSFSYECHELLRETLRKCGYAIRPIPPPTLPEPLMPPDPEWPPDDVAANPWTPPTPEVQQLHNQINDLKRRLREEQAYAHDCSSEVARLRSQLRRGSQPGGGAEQMILALTKQLDPVGFKKLYHMACLAAHPDRNGGDGEVMKQINIAWSELCRLKNWT